MVRVVHACVGYLIWLGSNLFVQRSGHAPAPPLDPAPFLNVLERQLDRCGPSHLCPAPIRETCPICLDCPPVGWGFEVVVASLLLGALLGAYVVAQVWTPVGSPTLALPEGETPASKGKGNKGTLGSGSGSW